MTTKSEAAVFKLKQLVLTQQHLVKKGAAATEISRVTEQISEVTQEIRDSTNAVVPTIEPEKLQRIRNAASKLERLRSESAAVTQILTAATALARAKVA